MGSGAGEGRKVPLLTRIRFFFENPPVLSGPDAGESGDASGGGEPANGTAHAGLQKNRLKSVPKNSGAAFGSGCGNALLCFYTGGKDITAP